MRIGGVNAVARRSSTNSITVIAFGAARGVGICAMLIVTIAAETKLIVLEAGKLVAFGLAAVNANTCAIACSKLELHGTIIWIIVKACGGKGNSASEV